MIEINEHLKINEYIQWMKKNFMLFTLSVARTILLPRDKGFFAKLPLEIIIYIFSFFQDFFYPLLTKQQIQKICEYASQKNTLGKKKKEFINLINITSIKQQNLIYFQKKKDFIELIFGKSVNITIFKLL